MLPVSGGNIVYKEDGMKIEFTKPTEYDYRKFIDSLTSADCLDGKVKIILSDGEGHTAELFVKQETVSRLGEDYIRSHVTMYYSETLCGWFAKLSENDYYNDPERNPEKVITLRFCGIECGTGREVYKEVETGRYFLRENFFPRETFARWYKCGKRRIPEDGNEVRANLIFECDGQREKVRYDDWNGVAAYGDTFNADFTPHRMLSEVI